MKPEHREELLARAMVGRYRLGYEEVALYLAGGLFETIINRKLIDYDNWTEWEINHNLLEKKSSRLCEISKALSQDSLLIPEMRHVFTTFFCKNGARGVVPMSPDDTERLKQVKERLNNFRWLRNKIMHGNLAKVGKAGCNVKDDLVLYVWRELAPNSFKRAFDKWEKKGRKGRIVDTLFRHTADYMIRGIDEVDIRALDNKVPAAKSAWCIEPTDFYNLFDLRSKLVALKNHLDGWLKVNANYLHTNTLTTIDTTSAYIWMPLTRLDSETQQGILSYSVSILTTPLDFRIYVDFGGMAARERQQYYNFLSSDLYRDIASTFVCHPDFYVFDTEWYCFITKKRSICAWLTDEKDQDIAVAQEKVKPLLNDITDPITWNRLLHGYILDKEYIENAGSINLNMIEQRLKDVISFFRSFEQFQRAR